MHPEENVRTHADRILAIKEIQRLAGELWCVADGKTAAIDEAHIHIAELTGELIEFLYTDAEFMGVDAIRLNSELDARCSTLLTVGGT